ncbi:hypothetical protein [Endozoicomonas acroporae]|uniref:hypothetical protein n=1 Tax=Endozoicomonas acroporae TaxID=1701104 RepID=UPI003D7B821F
MDQKCIWFNRSLGENGWLYWFLVCVLICPLIIAVLFVYSLFQSGYQLWEKGIFIIGIIFSLYHFSRGVLALFVTSLTAKELETKSGIPLNLKTFSGKVVGIENASFCRDTDGILERSYLQFLFPKNGEHIIVVEKNTRYYISSSTDNHSALIEEIGSLIDN